MGGLSSGGALSLKSIQRGTITIASTSTSATATISAVNTAKAELRYLGDNPSSDNLTFRASLVLTNSTTVTATRNSGTGSPNTVVSYEVTEWA